jgi:hypothetical protein
MERKFNEIYIALYHLVFIGNMIERTFKAFAGIIGRVDEDTERVFYVNTSSMIILLANSFLDEYHRFVRSEDPEMMETTSNIKKAVKPAVKLIGQWKEREDFRNQVLAHNLRGKNDESVFERGLTSFDVPQQGADLHVLVSCVGMIREVFASAFREKLAEVQKVLDSETGQKAARRYDRDSFETAIESVRREINENIRRLKEDQGVL